MNQKTILKYFFIYCLFTLLIIGYKYYQVRQIKRDTLSKQHNTLINPTPTPVVTIKPTVKPTKQQLPVLNGGKLFSLINQYRAANGLPFFTVSDELCRYAEKRADFMIANHREAFKTSSLGNHTGFDEMLSGYTGAGVGENLAMNTVGDQNTLALWQKSAAHDSLLLSSQIEGVVVSKACLATRVVEDGSITVFLVGDK